LSKTLTSELTGSFLVSDMSLSVLPSYDLSEDQRMFMFYKFGVVTRLTQFSELGFFLFIFFFFLFFFSFLFFVSYFIYKRVFYVLFFLIIRMIVEF
jgi:hypothetical protein